MKAVKLDAFGARMHAIHMQHRKSSNVHAAVKDASPPLVQVAARVDTAARVNSEPALDTALPLPDDGKVESEHNDDDDESLGGYDEVAGTASAFEANGVSTGCPTCGHEPLAVDSSPETLANEINMLKQRVTELETKLQDP